MEYGDKPRSGVYTVMDNKRKDVVYDLNENQFWSWVKMHVPIVLDTSGIDESEVSDGKSRYNILSSLIIELDGGFYRVKKEWENYEWEMISS